MLEDVLVCSSALGGNKPKATVEDACALWLATLAHTGDAPDLPAIEHAMLGRFFVNALNALSA